MAEDALTVVSLRNEFYKDSNRRVMLALLFSVMMNVWLVLACIYLYTYTPPPQYFATSIDGRYTPIVALNEPNQSDSAVLQWANQAAIAAFTYNFVNYREELRAASAFFTSDGWQQFINALAQSNNLDAVKAKKLVVSAVATGAPIILQKGILNGRYAWRIQMPVRVTYQSASEFTQDDNIITLLVTRISTLNSPQGIGISQFVVTPSSGGTGR
jgi:intracellular multiplication protein IcmL